MNYGHLERVSVALTVKSPLFIGSGVKLSPLEYILDGGTVYVPSIPDMLDAFANGWQRGLSDDFMSFITSPGREKKLSAFLRQRRIAMNPTPKWVRYAVRAQSDIAGMNTLLTFTRNPDGMAYIPGSSIKGAIRTALIASRMDARARERLRAELDENPRSRRASAVEELLRVLPCKTDINGNADRRNAVNDLLRAVSVSDSAPFPPESLTVCQRRWLSADGDARAKAPVFMECLRPNSVTRFDLTIDHALWPKDRDALAEIQAALRAWDALCHRAFDDHFSDLVHDIDPMQGAPVVLGGGTGFQRKSLVYTTSDDPERSAQLAEKVLRYQFRTYKPPQTARTAPYKYKAAHYMGADWPMGVCELRW